MSASGTPTSSGQPHAHESVGRKGAATCQLDEWAHLYSLHRNSTLWMQLASRMYLRQMSITCGAVCALPNDSSSQLEARAARLQTLPASFLPVNAALHSIARCHAWGDTYLSPSLQTLLAHLDR